MEARRDGTNNLARFFGSDRVDSLKKKLAEVLTDDEYKTFRRDAASWLDVRRLPGITGSLAGPVDDLLKTPVASALKKVYRKADILHRYLDPERYDPQATVDVELAEHTIESKHSPHLDIVINGQSMPALTLNVTVTLELKGLILTIRDAKIWKISPGSCKGSGDISFHGLPLVKKASETYRLPEIDFYEGLPIAP